MNVKHKFEIAYMPKSSSTTRITPEDYASLFTKLNDEQMQQFFAKVSEDIAMQGDDERRELMMESIKLAYQTIHESMNKRESK